MKKACSAKSLWLRSSTLHSTVFASNLILQYFFINNISVPSLKLWKCRLFQKLIQPFSLKPGTSLIHIQTFFPLFYWRSLSSCFHYTSYICTTALTNCASFAKILQITKRSRFLHLDHPCLQTPIWHHTENLKFRFSWN